MAADWDFLYKIVLIGGTCDDRASDHFCLPYGMKFLSLVDPLPRDLFLRKKNTHTIRKYFASTIYPSHIYRFFLFIEQIAE